MYIDLNSSNLSEWEVYLNGLRCEIRELKSRGTFNFKKIAIIGCWRYVKEIKRILKEENLSLGYILDNNSNKWGEINSGILCESPRKYVNKKEICVLVINNQFCFEIVNQLIKYGYMPNSDFFVLFGGESFKQRVYKSKRLFETNQEWLQKKEMIRRVYGIYTAIISKYGDKEVWLMHPPCLGDLYIFSLFLPYHYKKWTVVECDCILIVTKNSVKKLAEAIGYKNVEVISMDSAIKEWLPFVRLIGSKLGIYNAVKHGLNSNFDSMIYYTDLNFKDSFIKYVFNLAEDTVPIYPVFPNRKHIIDENFKNNGLIPGRTVVISPYAGHFDPQIDEEKWIWFVGELHRRGYSVCTNCNGIDEEPIKNTCSANIEIQDAEKYIERAGFFIGIRSGFCDIISNANGKKYIIYEKNSSIGSMDFFGFKKMNIGHGFIEHVIENNNIDKVFQDILNEF